MAHATGAMVIGVDLDVDPARSRPGGPRAARGRPPAAVPRRRLRCALLLPRARARPGSRRGGCARRDACSNADGWVSSARPTRRLVGYVGGRATTAEKIRWNLADWGQRLRGRFENARRRPRRLYRSRAGRPAGRVLRARRTGQSAYYLGKYPRLEEACGGHSSSSGMSRFVIPSVYFRATDDRSPGAAPH